MWADEIPCTTDPRSDVKLRAHLLGDHEFPVDVLDNATARDWKMWHDGEHSTRHPSRIDASMHKGHLRHIHERFLPKTS